MDIKSYGVVTQLYWAVTRGQNDKALPLENKNDDGQTDNCSEPPQLTAVVEQKIKNVFKSEKCIRLTTVRLALTPCY